MVMMTIECGAGQREGRTYAGASIPSLVFCTPHRGISPVLLIIHQSLWSTRTFFFLCQGSALRSRVVSGCLACSHAQRMRRGDSRRLWGSAAVETRWMSCIVVYECFGGRHAPRPTRPTRPTPDARALVSFVTLTLVPRPVPADCKEGGIHVRTNQKGPRKEVEEESG